MKAAEAAAAAVASNPTADTARKANEEGSAAKIVASAAFLAAEAVWRKADVAAMKGDNAIEAAANTTGVIAE